MFPRTDDGIQEEAKRNARPHAALANEADRGECAADQVIVLLATSDIELSPPVAVTAWMAK